jgi:glycosyltransferase involved in cell wall biosynthesis
VASQALSYICARGGGLEMTDDRALAASLIVPTHNRCDLLQRVLDALGDQDCTQPFEVIVVADGCVDETAAMLSSHRAPYPLRMVATDGVGPAQARNVGADLARAPLLVFLDDDVIPVRGFLSAHLAAHLSTNGCAVLGPYPPEPNASPNLFRLRARHWWTDHFARIARPGHRFGYRDLLTGNLSLPAELWRRAGGLDPQFRHAREDYELGVRLMDMNVRFVFAPEALGYHQEHLTMSLEGSYRRAREEGRSDVRIGLKHPRIRPGLRVILLCKRSRRLQRLLDRSLLLLRGLLDRPAAACGRLLTLLERRGLRRAYLRLYSALNRYWYLRGAMDELGSLYGWREYVNAASAPRAMSDVTIDLRNGVAAGEETLDSLRPKGACLVYGHHLVGVLADEPGSERCRGEHLRPFLIERCGPRLLRVMARGEQIVPASEGDIERLAMAITAAVAFYGPPRPEDMWLEQYGQWWQHGRRATSRTTRARGRTG